MPKMPTAPPVMPAGTAIIVFDEIDSTMDEARRQLTAGAATPLWILAARQTKGRGRRSRPWESADGNLFCTLALRPEAAPAQAATLSFLAAVAVAETLENWVFPTSDHPQRLQCKWPNDVLLDGRKVAGILLESEMATGGGGLAWLTIGIGVNLATHPEIAERPATSLAGAGCAVPHPHQVLSLMAEKFADWMARWQEAGFAPVKQAWLARAARFGQEIDVRLDKQTLHGIFSALDDSGALLLQQANGECVAVTAGDVFFPDVK